MEWKRDELIAAFKEVEQYDSLHIVNFATSYPAISRLLSSLERDFLKCEREGVTSPSPKPHYGGGGGTTSRTNTE